MGLDVRLNERSNRGDYSYRLSHGRDEIIAVYDIWDLDCFSAEPSVRNLLWCVRRVFGP